MWSDCPLVEPVVSTLKLRSVSFFPILQRSTSEVSSDPLPPPHFSLPLPEIVRTEQRHDKRASPRFQDNAFSGVAQRRFHTEYRNCFHSVEIMLGARGRQTDKQRLLFSCCLPPSHTSSPPVSHQVRHALCHCTRQWAQGTGWNITFCLQVTARLGHVTWEGASGLFDGGRVVSYHVRVYTSKALRRNDAALTPPGTQSRSHPE